MTLMILTDDRKQQLEQRVAAFESATGIELVTVLLPRCDDYPELPWKAFATGTALAAALTGLLVFTGVAVSSDLLVVGIPGAGLACALAAVFVPFVARLFLDSRRAEAESRQAAQALFLEHEVFSTAARSGILMLVSVFEKQVVLLADRGLRDKLHDDDLQKIIHDMTPLLARNDHAASFESGIASLQAMVMARGYTGGPGNGAGNTLPDHVAAPETDDGM